MTDKPLTPKEEAFATGLAAGLSQSDAYRQAYPHSQKWRAHAIHSRASTLAASEKVQQRFAELREKAAAANEVTIERIVAELAKIAFGDARRVMKWGPRGVELLDSEQLPDDAAAIVSEVSETVSKEGGSLKVKTHDKLGALRMLADIKGFVVKKHELTGKDGKDLPAAPTGVLVVPGVMEPEDWEAMMVKSVGAAGGAG